MNFKCPPRGAHIGCRLKRNIDKPRCALPPYTAPSQNVLDASFSCFFLFYGTSRTCLPGCVGITAIFRRTGEGNFLLRGTFWEERLIFTRLIFLLNQEDMGSQRRLMWLPAPNGTAAPNTGKKKKKQLKKNIRLSVSNGIRSISFFFPL